MLEHILLDTIGGGRFKHIDPQLQKAAWAPCPKCQTTDHEGIDHCIQCYGGETLTKAMILQRPLRLTELCYEILRHDRPVSPEPTEDAATSTDADLS